ncbi:MAG TPA: NAD-dependent epimerase/dehydratase family protein [Polyangiaceae bacterium]|nr:NAD-dependent epimerase/dehydratase family protein [Polyangiaceae bacterium]
MRVIVTGATGNVGTSVLESLARDPDVTEIVGVARRVPELHIPKTTFVSADVAIDDLTSLFQGAHAVVHLAWLLRGSGEEELERVNVHGSLRVFDSVVRAGVPQLAVASSIGAYAAGPKDDRVDEQWPTTGIPTSLYSRQKVRIERALDELQHAEPQLVVTRLRPALIFKRGASTEIKRLFIGRWVPPWVFRSRAVRVVPETPGLCLQVVHSLDVGDAFCRAVTRRIGGAFNIAADPPLNPDRLVRALDATPVWIPQRVLRGAVKISYGLGLQPTSPGWVDLAFNCPLMSTAKAAAKLGWTPQYSSVEAIQELLVGLEQGAGMRTAPLQADREHTMYA